MGSSARLASPDTPKLELGPGDVDPPDDAELLTGAWEEASRSMAGGLGRRGRSLGGGCADLPPQEALPQAGFLPAADVDEAGAGGAQHDDLDLAGTGVGLGAQHELLAEAAGGGSTVGMSTVGMSTSMTSVFVLQQLLTGSGSDDAPVVAAAAAAVAGLRLPLATASSSSSQRHLSHWAKGEA
jgi:hypothetical protein